MNKGESQERYARQKNSESKTSTTFRVYFESTISSKTHSLLRNDDHRERIELDSANNWTSKSITRPCMCERIASHGGRIKTRDVSRDLRGDRRLNHLSFFLSFLPLSCRDARFLARRDLPFPSRARFCERKRNMRSPARRYRVARVRHRIPRTLSPPRFNTRYKAGCVSRDERHGGGRLTADVAWT